MSFLYNSNNGVLELQLIDNLQIKIHWYTVALFIVETQNPTVFYTITSYTQKRNLTI